MSATELSVNKQKKKKKKWVFSLTLYIFYFFSVRLICCQAGGCFCNSGRLQKLIYPNNQVLLGRGGWDTEMALVGKAVF